MLQLVLPAGMNYAIRQTNMPYPCFYIELLNSGASKQLGVIIEGESLLNDGAAIVLFNVFKDELIPQQGRNGL